MPREALALAVDLETAVVAAPYRYGSEMGIEQLAEIVRKRKRIDTNGFGKMHYELLEILVESGRPMGISAIASLMETVDEARITDDIEPFLVKKGLVSRRQTGRQITAEGRDYIERNSYLE